MKGSGRKPWRHLVAALTLPPVIYFFWPRIEARMIANKSENLRLWEAGAFGNKLRSWASLEAYHADPFPGQVVLRYRGESGGKWCVYNISRAEVEPTVAQWLSEGAERSRIYVNEGSLASMRVTLQGEAMRTPQGLYLRYSRVDKPMRQALAEETRHATGLLANALLHQFMDPASIEDLNDLLDKYDGHAIEFSCWDGTVGDCGRNSVIWEVRAY